MRTRSLRAALGTLAFTALFALAGCQTAMPLDVPPAQEQAAPEILETIGAARLQQLLHELGYANTEIDEDGDIKVRMQSLYVLALLNGTESPTIQMYFAIRAPDTALEKVNAWNRGYRFSRAYLDRDGDPVLQSDLDLEGGVTEERIKDFLRTFDALLGAFRREVL